MRLCVYALKIENIIYLFNKIKTMSFLDNSNIVNSGLKLLVKYIGLKHLLVGSLQDDELDFLKNMIALDEKMYHSVLHSFNRPKNPIISNGSIINDKFLKGYYKYYDVKHEIWGEKGLCPKSVAAVNQMADRVPDYARIVDNYGCELQTKSYSYQYRRVAILDVPWKNTYNANSIKKIKSECVFTPYVVTYKNPTGETVIKGLYVRVEKDKIIKLLKAKKLYNRSTTNKDWGCNYSLKSTFRNISCELTKCSTIGQDMKTVLTPIKLNNDDPLPMIVVPKNIYKHHSKEVLLKRYQLANVAWMVNLERNLNDYSINTDKTIEIMPKVYFDHLNEIVYDSRQSKLMLTPRGGGLFDEVGLGKTLTCITLICANKPPENIGCSKLKIKVVHSTQAVCQAYIKSGKRVKENGGKPIKCGRVIKVSKPSKSTKKSSTSGTATKKQKTTPRTLPFLIKHKVCTMHSKYIKETDTTDATDATDTTDATEAKPISSPKKIDSSGVDVQKKDGRWMSRATLVICPNQIPYQWLSQVKQYTNPCLDVLTITNLHEARKLTYRDVINADVIITTIDCIERGTVTSLGADIQTPNHISEISKITLDTNCPAFNLIWWHRVVIDEMHRVTNKKYKNAVLRVFKIPTTYKWAVTGTPFQKDQLNYDVMVSWLYSTGSTSFSKNPRQRLFSKIQSHSNILTSIFRRNTKKSTEHLTPVGGGEFFAEQNAKLWQTVTQTELWLDLSKIERAMYNARKASKPYWTKDRNDEYLRQICCHPNLSAENSKIVYAVNNSGVKAPIGQSRYATNANDVKQALLDHNKALIEKMIKIDIPTRITASWNAQSIYLMDKKHKKNRMAYYGTVHQLKRAFFKLYQLRKSNRAYTDLYGNNSTPIIIRICDGCFTNIIVQGESVDIHVGECGHVFCSKCASPKFKSPFVDLSKYSQTTIKGVGGPPTKKAKTGKPGKTGKPVKSKTYERKITDGYAMCRSCTQTLNSDQPISVVTIGMTDAIKVDPRELMMDMHSNTSGEDSSDSESEEEEQSLNEYIPKQFKEEMDCAIGLYGTKVTHLIAYLKTYTAKPYNHRIIIFSQWDNLLQGIMETLNNFDLPAMMCKGNVFQKKKAIVNFKTNSYYKIILLSSKYAASGLDLIEANKVIFIDPIYGDFDTVKQIEDQAIGRAHRLGQKNPIDVVRFLIKDSIEEECYKDWQKTITEKV